MCSPIRCSAILRPCMDATDDSQARWDRAKVHAFSGTYGDYVLDKVGKVFPELRGEVLD